MSERQSIDDFRRSRRHPSRGQHDYLHLRHLVADYGTALAGLGPHQPTVLDLFCGARPYEDLLPAGATVVGFDVSDDWGVADVVSTEFLPFPDDSFDLVVCTQAFYYVPEPVAAVAELGRVLRPGGAVVITVPHVQEYERSKVEWRYTGPQLARLFDGWDGVEIRESGGRLVALATEAGRLLLDVQHALMGRRATRPLSRPFGYVAFRVFNAVAAVLERVDRRIAKPGFALPSNLLLIARRPAAPEGARR